MKKKENLQKLNLTQLAALYAFWDNRLVKEIEKIYNSYFIMYELDLDDKTTVQNKDATNKLLPQQLENLNVKTALLDSLISNIYYQYRDTHLEGGEVSIEDALSKISAKFGAEYQKYFSGICGLNVHENNFDKDIVLRLKTENAIRNLYLQKDNGITGLLNLLYNGDVSENWGIIDENPRSKFVLLVADINGLNMPLRLHIEREKVKEFAIMILMITIISIFSIKVEATTGRINSETVNIRKEPNTDSTIIDQLDKDCKVEILEQENGWYKIKVDEKNITGYVSDKLVETDEDDTTGKQDTATSTAETAEGRRRD